MNTTITDPMELCAVAKHNERKWKVIGKVLNDIGCDRYSITSSTLNGDEDDWCVGVGANGTFIQTKTETFRIDDIDWFDNALQGYLKQF